MLRTNLSTRPFYNVRAVHVTLAALALLVLAVTLFNTVQIIRLTAQEASLGSKAEAAEEEATRLRAEAARIRAQIDRRELEAVATAAREANAIIDSRAFSWTALFSQFERTLPDDVRITAVQPKVERDGRFTVAVRVESRDVEDLDAFIEALETQSTFRNVLAVQEQATDDGLIEAVVEGTYVPEDTDVAVPAGGTITAPEGGS